LNWFAKIGPPRTELYEERHPMTWIKPEFEFIELCSEVTSYLFHR